MQRYNKLQCQSHGIGMALFPGEGETKQVVLEGILWTVCEQSDTHFMKIIPENISHSYVITFQASEQCKVQYIRQAQSIGWHKTS